MSCLWSRVALLPLAGCLAVLPASAEKLPSGTELTLRLETEVAPDRNTSQNFSALLSYPVFVQGREVLPAGSRVEGEVRGSKKKIVLSPRYLFLPDGQRVYFNAAVKEIDRKRLRAEEKEGTIQGKGSGADAARQAAEIGMTGAAIGAMSTGSAKGMGIGAGAGVAAVLIGRKIANRNKATYIPAGTQLTVSLSRPLDVPDNATSAQASEKRSADPDDRRPILRRRD